MIYRLKLLFILVLGSAFNAFGQEAPQEMEMVTDRPDQTESPSLVPKGYFQVETGILQEVIEVGEVRLLNYSTLIRVGLLDNLEMRIGADYHNSKYPIPEFENSGFLPLIVGTKVGIAEENGILPEIGLLGHIHLPFFANKEIRPENTGVDFRFAFSHTLSERADLSYNLGAQWSGYSFGGATYVYTLAYGYEFQKDFTFYMELYGDLPEDHKAFHFWDAGFTYKLRPNFQLDASFGTGIDNDQKYLYGAGVSFRLPN